MFLTPGGRGYQCEKCFVFDFGGCRQPSVSKIECNYHLESARERESRRRLSRGYMESRSVSHGVALVLINNIERVCKHLIGAPRPPLVDKWLCFSHSVIAGFMSGVV